MDVRSNRTTKSLQSAAANEALQLQINERHRGEARLQQLKNELRRDETKLIGARVRHTETLLFVEDEPRQLQLMQSFLKGEGFAVLTARDGAEAVEVHRRFKDEIAVVILDLGLAKMNGWQAFQMMKKLNPQLKGILASGYLSPDVEPRQRRMEMCDIAS
jgi:CheY-like chemotaxis protein